MESKVVVITGASSGIGAALAGLLGAGGHRIVLAARRKKELEEVAESAGKGALVQVTDVTRREDVERLKDVALEKCGRVDVWVNNAGRGISIPVLELSDENVDEILDVNLKSAIYGMQVIVPVFKRQAKGHLINISSFLGKVPLVTVRSIYSAAKAALNVLTANLRMDLRREFPDIHVSLVMPGVVATEFRKNVIGGSTSWQPGQGSVLPGAQTAEEVAKSIASLIEHPRSEIYTNPASEDIARRYREDIEAFEEGLLK